MVRRGRARQGRTKTEDRLMQDSVVAVKDDGMWAMRLTEGKKEGREEGRNNGMTNRIEIQKRKKERKKTRTRSKKKKTKEIIIFKKN